MGVGEAAFRYRNPEIYGLGMHGERANPGHAGGQGRIGPAMELGAALGGSGDASAPLPVKIPRRRCESEQSERGRSRRRDHPGLDPATGHWPSSTTTPSIPPAASPVGKFGVGGISHRKQLAGYFAPPESISPNAKGVVLPYCPPSPTVSPNVPVSPPSVPATQLHLRLVARTRGHGVLLDSAACCATPSCTSRKHRRCRAPVTLHPCTGDKPRRGARAGDGGGGMMRPQHHQAAEKAASLPQNQAGIWVAGTGVGGKDGFGPPGRGRIPLGSSAPRLSIYAGGGGGGGIDLWCHTQKE